MSDAPNPFASPLTSAADNAPRTDWSGIDLEAMGKVRRGLTLTYVAIVLGILFVIASPFLSFGFATQVGDPSSMTGLFTAIAAVGFGLLLLFLAGTVLCISVPKESGGKELAIAASSLFTIAVLANLFATFVQPLGTVLGIVVGILFYAAPVCFILFMRKSGLYIDRPDIARRATRTLVVGLVSLGLLLGYFGWVASNLDAMQAGNADMPGWVMVIMFIGGLGTLVAMIMFANTITYLRKAIVTDTV